MNITRNGKIARLPNDIREELNRRLWNGERGNKLVSWLNSRPEVRAVMAEEFGGSAIRAQNLSEWKQGGYADWLRQQESLKMLEQLAANEGEAFKAAKGPLTEKMVTWLTARYLVAAQKLRAGEEAADWNRLRELCNDVAMLRRGDHLAQRLEFEREARAARGVSRPTRPTLQGVKIMTEDEHDDGGEDDSAAAGCTDRVKMPFADLPKPA